MKIEPLALVGPAGRIEGLVKLPDGAPASGPVPAAAVVCHPHPLFGGTMHNKVVHAAAEALAGRGMPVIRFNFRGAGLSGGKHDAGHGEQEDLRAALDHVAERYPGSPLVVAGYSFGAFVGLKVGCRDARVKALVGIGIPTSLYDFGFLAGCRVPLTLIQGENDRFGPLPLVMALAATLPGGARVVPMAGAEHGFDGHLDEVARAVAEAIPPELTGGSAPGRS